VITTVADDDLQAVKRLSAPGRGGRGLMGAPSSPGGRRSGTATRTRSRVGTATCAGTRRKGFHLDQRRVDGHIFVACDQCKPTTFAFGIITSRPSPIIAFYAITREQYHFWINTTDEELEPALDEDRETMDLLHRLGYTRHSRGKDDERSEPSAKRVPGLPRRGARSGDGVQRRAGDDDSLRGDDHAGAARARARQRGRGAEGLGRS
jgi:hypothetical protein